MNPSNHILAIDIGNTSIKTILFSIDGDIIKKFKFTGQDNAEFNNLLEDKKDIPIIYSSTSILNTSLATFFEKVNAHKVSSQSKLPFSIKYSTPDTLGSDRMAAVAGAWAQSPDRNILVIDAGTCITYEIILQDAQYIGGCISPGLKMRLSAMHHFTSKLPDIKADREFILYGDSTESAMKAGAQTGFLTEIEGFVRLYQNKFSDLHIYITGGDAPYAMKHLNIAMEHDPDLVLKGLFKIWSCQ
jgi:type III pantothenate kinase